MTTTEVRWGFKLFFFDSPHSPECCSFLVFFPGFLWFKMKGISLFVVVAQGMATLMFCLHRNSAGHMGPLELANWDFLRFGRFFGCTFLLFSCTLGTPIQNMFIKNPFVKNVEAKPGIATGIGHGGKNSQRSS